jgi:diadenosine tetraphosphate (Ap4A) HIT family hydrolase
MADCSLCELAAGRRRGLRLYEDPRLVVVLELRAGHPARLLVVPRRHSSGPGAANDDLHTHMLETGQRAARSLDDAGIAFSAGHAEITDDGEHVYAQILPQVQLRAS